MLRLYIHGLYETLEINKNETIRDLKLKIEDNFGIDPDFQKLTYYSSILEDDKKLEDYEIPTGSLIAFEFYRR